MVKKLLIYSCIICFVLFPAFTDSNVKAKGPILSSNLYPLYLPYINMKPEAASTLDKGTLKSSVSINYANNCHYDEELLYENYTFLLDMEIYEAAIDFDYGIYDRFSAGFSVSYTGAYTGLADPFISSFHKFFNLPNGHRDDVGDNEFHYYIENTEGEYIEQNGKFSGINNILVRAKYLLWENDPRNFMLSVRYGLKIPNSTDFGPLSSGKTDHSLNLLMEKCLSNFNFYSGMGFIYLGKPDYLEVFDFNELLFDYFISVEYAPSEKLSFIIQLDGSSSPYGTEVNHEYVDLHSASSSYGIKYETVSGQYLGFAFMEEGISFAAIDIGIILSYEMIF